MKELSDLGLLGVIVGLIVIPGLIGDLFCRRIAGDSRHQRDWRAMLWVLTISIIALLMSMTVMRQLGWLVPVHLFGGAIPSQGDIDGLVLVYVCQFISAAVLGLVAGLGLRRLALGSPDAWDIFVRREAATRWVVVALTNGDCYAGMLRSADITVSEGERDIILAEPAAYHDESKSYETLPYKSLFLQGGLIFSIAAFSEPEDERVTSAGQQLFAGGDSARKDKASATATV